MPAQIIDGRAIAGDVRAEVARRVRKPARRGGGACGGQSGGEGRGGSGVGGIVEGPGGDSRRLPAVRYIMRSC